MMQTAEVWSRRSTCFRRNVGAVIAINNRIVSIGYNGAPAGKEHCLGKYCVPVGVIGCTRAVHAEINALNHVPSQLISPLMVMYVTESPCRDCAEALVVDGVHEIYYLNEYRDPSGIDVLLRADRKVYRMTPSGYIVDRATGELIGDI